QHCDGRRYSGSFTFFVHYKWSVHWGGELLVSQDFKANIASESSEKGGESWLAEEADGDMDAGVSTCIIPIPNRLVLIGPDCPHRVARVDQNAGARVRASIAGFFLRPE